MSGLPFFKLIRCFLFYPHIFSFFFQDAKSHPTDGVLVYGMHIEGASWDHATKRLCDPRPDQMRAPAPIVHFLPETDHESNPGEQLSHTRRISPYFLYFDSDSTKTFPRVDRPLPRPTIDVGRFWCVCCTPDCLSRNRSIGKKRSSRAY